MSGMYINSDYAKNRNPNEIVYQSSTGQVIKITVDVYAESIKQNEQNDITSKNMTIQKADQKIMPCPKHCKCIKRKCVKRKLQVLRQRLKTKALNNEPLAFADLKELSDLEYKLQWQNDDVEYKRAEPSGTPQDYAEWKREYNSRNAKTKIIFRTGKTISHHPSAEQDYFISEKKHDETLMHKKRLCIANAALAQLTAKQRRRYFLYYVHDKSIREIADIEGIPNHNAITKSLKQAQIKIEKYLKTAMDMDT